jgi:acetylornithine deacetylase/succinyl-diaminopimelate desuccinylase-like protein
MHGYPAHHPVTQLVELIGIPSVNPMGGHANSDVHYEHRMTDFLEKWFDDRGMPTERHVAVPATDTAPVREVLIAGFSEHAVAKRPLIMLEAHQDTVPTTGMTIDPFDAVVRGGRVYGRGACDVKGSLACLLAVAQRLRQLCTTDRPAVVFAFSVNEEHGFDGARKLQQIWSSGQSALLRGAPDAVVVSEPTQLDVVVAHKGVVRWRCRTHGSAAHSSNPTAGVNAIYRMAAVVSGLQQFQETILSRRPPHSLVGSPSLSVGTIHGGISANTIPDSCVIEIDRRLLPDESPTGARQEIIDWLGQRVDASWLEQEPPFITSPGLGHDANGELADVLLGTVQEEHPSAQLAGVPFGTDAAYLSLGAVPTVVFGPGSIAQAHTADEWIQIEELERAVEILTSFVRQYV